MRIFKTIKSWLVPSEPYRPEITPLPATFTPHFDYDDVALPDILGNINSNKVLLLLDDQPAVFDLYDMDFVTIKRRYDFDVMDEFKVVKCVGIDAGFIAHKYLIDNTDSIVIALLDITLGKMVKIESGETLEFDGIDIALEILAKHPRCKINFCSGHFLSNDNRTLTKYVTKFEKTGMKLQDYYFNKNDSKRTDKIYQLMTDEVCDVG